MSEFEILIAGLVGGALSGAAMSLAFLGHIKFIYDERIKTLQYQVAALRVEINTGYVE